MEKSGIDFSNTSIQNLHITSNHQNITQAPNEAQPSAIQEFLRKKQKTPNEAQYSAIQEFLRKKQKRKADKHNNNSNSDSDSIDDDREDSDNNAMVVLNDKTIKTTTTRLEQILNIHERIEKCIDANMDLEAFGILQKLHDYGKSISMLPAYVNYYVTLLKTDRGNEAEAIFEKICSILMEENLHMSFKECYKQAEKFRLQKKYFKSILFHLIGGSMLLCEKDADRLLSGAQGFMLGIKMCIIKINNEFSHFCEAVKSFILPKLRHLQRSIFELDIAKNKKDIVLVEAICLHHLEISERYTGDIEGGGSTLKHTLERLHAVLGDDATKSRFYGTTLNNLGAFYMQTRRYADAQQALRQAVEVIENATDYSELERKADLVLAQSALETIDEIIHSASFEHTI